MAVHVDHPVGHPLVKYLALPVVTAVADAFADGVGGAGWRGDFPTAAVVVG